MKPYGKLSQEELLELLGILTRRDPSVLLGPAIGEDAAIVDLGDKVLVTHSDPITGASELAGWLSVHVAANDIATRGVKPSWLVTTLLLPQTFSREQLKKLASQIRSAADEIDATVIGGHTEVTPGLDRPIIITTAFGVGEKKKYITTSGARDGDLLVATKDAALEGTSIIATDFHDKLLGKIDKSILENAKNFIREISVVKEALTAAQIHGVHAMHDATEGGILAAALEIAYASRLSIVLYEEKVPIRRETAQICRALGLDPLRLISSGTLLIAVQPESAPILIERLQKEGIKATIIGEFKKNGHSLLVKKTGEKIEIGLPVAEELWRLF